MIRDVFGFDMSVFPHELDSSFEKYVTYVIEFNHTGKIEGVVKIYGIKYISSVVRTLYSSILLSTPEEGGV